LKLVDRGQGSGTLDLTQDGVFRRCVLAEASRLAYRKDG
jgi:hypothetical protein